jgi:integrase/recombinase XerD
MSDEWTLPIGDRQSTIGNALADYLTHLESLAYSPSRLRQVHNTLEKLALYLSEEHGVHHWREVIETHLTGFAVYAAERYRTWQGRPVSASTRSQWLVMIRSFFAWLRSTGRLLHDPAVRLPLPRPSRTLPYVPSEAAIARLIELPDLSTAVGLRDLALMETLYATGLRHAEAHRLDLYDVDLSTRRLVVRQGKGRRDRIVPLTPQASHWLTRYLESARPELAARFSKKKTNQYSTITPRQSVALWLGIHGRRLSYVTLARRIGHYARQAHLKVTVHTFRHACATHLLCGGASIRHIQQLLGHRDLNTTELYTHLTVEDLKTAVHRAFPDTRQ